MRKGLDDLCVRFIINLPKSELESVERICFQVEEAQWFYEDFIRPLDPTLPSLNLRAFSLKIFQHCSLFSQWSPEHHMSAFAEFLAYKQRVPVRGAIMLNDDMDQVVLVKGWKKGANWSFPRGKINKEENDLDCAIREVYEETGFDIQEAGLVKDEKEMKYIEVTMREQHMRLYVFRGVPMDTHFEPRTRKEISKIEWYKLTELPTLKKHKHQDSNGQPQVVNANKFYMVAPFLNPLKKWISQQRKSENRQSLPYLAPPPLSEEISQDEAEVALPQLQQIISHGPSSLPEVAYTARQEQDPSADLKRLLNIKMVLPVKAPTPQLMAAPQSDAVKSSALLALLRSGSTAEMRDMPHTPRDQISFAPPLPRSPHRPHPQPPPFSSMPSPSRFRVSPESANTTTFVSQRFPVPTEFRGNQPFPQFANQPLPEPTAEVANVRSIQEVHNANLQRFAPYQNTGDPQFSQSRIESSHTSGVPPASALPKLTNHTKTLLDAFKMAPASPVSAPPPQVSPLPPQIAKVPSAQTQTLLDIFNTKPRAVPAFHEAEPPASTSADQTTAGINQMGTTIRKQNLMDVFRQPSSNPMPTNQPPQLTSTESHLAELAADVVAAGTGIRPLASTPQMLPGSKRDKATHAKKRHDQPAGPREGETAATLNGPLNQPQFESIIRSARKATNGDRRSPVPANKTLYDPKNPTPVKILARPEWDARRSPARSPRLPKANPPSSSPRRGVTPKDSKETPKPFQPQILRRPQTPSATAMQSKENASQLVIPSASSRPADNVQATQKTPLQADSHRQALLSLFNKPLQTTIASPVIHDPVSAISTTVPASQPISPMTDAQLDGIEAISTRPRVSSLASAGSAIRPSIEKRQTAAGDKAFLLGYLGRIASKEGQ